MRKFVALGASLIVLLALAGCSGTSDATPTAVPTTRPSATSALGSLIPVYPSKLTSATAKSETERVADAVQGLIAKTDIVYVDNHAKLVAATSTAPSYYGVLRTVNVSQSLDPVQQATAMSKLLVAAGWTEQKNESATGTYIDQLTSAKRGSKVWLLQLSGDSTIKDQPVVTIDILSPDLPTK